MGKYSKYINAVFVGAGVITWFLAKNYTEVVSGYFQLGRRIGGGVEYINHGLPILLALMVFMILRGKANTYNFVSDSVSEMVKVVWPGKKDVRLGTIVVIMTVLLAGVFLGVVDLGFNSLVRGILGT